MTQDEMTRLERIIVAELPAVVANGLLRRIREEFEFSTTSLTNDDTQPTPLCEPPPCEPLS